MSNMFGRKGEASHYQVPPDTASTLSGIPVALVWTPAATPAGPRNPPRCTGRLPTSRPTRPGRAATRIRR